MVMTDPISAASIDLRLAVSYVRKVSLYDYEPAPTLLSVARYPRN